MKKNTLHTFFNIAIASIWLINGAVCKITNCVPRHQLIVQKILDISSELGRPFTIAIGLGEVLMSFWIISNVAPKTNVAIQITAICLMNILEFFCAPELLLWGKCNIIFAGLLVFTIYYNFMVLKDKQQS